MKLLSAFSGLLLTLQFVGAVHSTQLQQPRFVKVKRTVSEHGTQADRLQPGLERRGNEDAILGVQNVIKYFESLAGSSSDASHVQALSRLKELEASLKRGGSEGTHYFKPDYRPVNEHHGNPEGFGVGQYSSPYYANPWEAVNKHGDELAEQGKTLGIHKDAINAVHERVETHSQNIEDMAEAQQKVAKVLAAQRKSDRLQNIAIGAATAAATVAAITSMAYSHGSTQTFQQHEQEIEELRAELKRLKGVQPGSVSAGQGGAGTDARGTPLAAGQPAVSASGGLV